MCLQLQAELWYYCNQFNVLNQRPTPGPPNQESETTMPTFTMPNFTVPNLTMPNFTMPTGLDFSKLDLSKLQLPKFDMRKFDMPTIDWPKADLPKVDLPGVDVERLGDLARDAAYAGVGLVVLTVEKIAERGRQLQAEFTARTRQLADAIA